MDDITTIKKNLKLNPSQDYEFLRQEGLKHIERLSHDLWTDYNAHDPGITILEALCYAITELGYRCGFDIKDLLTDENGNIVDSQTFFTAKEILTNEPLTINDYRKLLIDITGVHNAFLYSGNVIYDEKKNPHPVNEAPVYADCKKDELTFEPDSMPLYLSGLYRVLLDLDYDDSFGDLNNGDIIIGNPGTAKFAEGEFLFSIELPSWKDADFNFAEAAKDESRISSAVISEKEKYWSCKLTLTDNTTGKFKITLPKNPDSKTVLASDVQAMFDNKNFVSGIFNAYFEKITKAKNIVRTAVKTLHKHRNLCEDFLSVTTVDVEDIAFCFDVDVKPEADIEKIQAEIFYAIENYLNPSVDFYSLKELLDKKIPVDEIFEGTILEHGFIETAQLEKAILRQDIHTSDIINLLMDIEGVLSIRNFVMSKYDNDGSPVKNYTGLKWCMAITPLHKPVLSQDKSKILLFKNQIPFIARYAEVRDTIQILHAQRSRAKLNGLEDDIPVPAGEKRDSESYWPVQYDFPQTYGIGQFGLPSNAKPRRIAQQRQLKAYLMFYEQLLADFFSQLSNAHQLFSISDIRQTYYAQFLNDIKDIESIYRKTQHAEPPPNEISLKDVFQNSDSTAINKNSWQDLYEPKDLFEDRRNRFLDHLLSRFAESFNDYAMMMYIINYNEKTEEKLDFKELTKAKIKTLAEYPEISSKRGTAFNYYPQPAAENDFSVDNSKLWDTDNVSGLEKRISTLTGIENYNRRFLYCIKNIEIICNEERRTENGKEIVKCFHSFSVTNLSGLIMQSVVEYETKEKAQESFKEISELGKARINYSYDTADKKLKLGKDTTEILLASNTIYADENSAMTAADEFITEFLKDCGDPAGLHLIEHILLRPRDVSFNLMEVCLHDCGCQCELDPYTFRASVLLPAWPGHFDNMTFRQYFENKLREEAPAQVMLKICWLDNDLMRKFEVCYKKWIETLADYSFDKTDINNVQRFRDANNSMLEILSRLHSEYPLATLHDCVESKEGSNTVVLGKTVLGTFKNL